MWQYYEALMKIHLTTKIRVFLKRCFWLLDVFSDHLTKFWDNKKNGSSHKTSRTTLILKHILWTIKIVTVLHAQTWYKWVKKPQHGLLQLKLERFKRNPFPTSKTFKNKIINWLERVGYGEKFEKYGKITQLWSLKTSLHHASIPQCHPPHWQTQPPFFSFCILLWIMLENVTE